MEAKEDPKKTEIEQSVTLQLPVQILEFAEFYASLGGTERDVLLTRLVVERLKEIKAQVKALPCLDIPELY